MSTDERQKSSAVPLAGRRAWLAGGAAVAAASAFPALRWVSPGRAPSPPDERGGLRPDPDGILDLREGFSYRVVQQAGQWMSDRRPVPARPDGMACFEGPGGSWVLMRNHELPAGLPGRMITGESPREAYDEAGAGGVSRVVVDPRTLEVRASNLVLAGTSMNCSGGASPWGWLSCEEDPRDPRHGFVFLCDPGADGVREPRRIDAYGRFKHEAAAVHPETAVCYLTEDQGDSCFYRFVPHDPARPFEGRLQALRVRGRPGEDTAPLATGARREIDWVDVGDAVPDRDELRHRARQLGAAAFRRGEGVCLADGAVCFTATTGGPIEAGQIWRLEDEGEGGTLEVLAASTDRGALDMPDNVAMSPSGTLFFVEDGPGHDFLRGVGHDGAVFEVARNAASEGELTGVCFAPDGRTLFLNLQEEGLTVAIRGPFDRLSARLA